MHFLRRYHWLVHTVAALNLAIAALIVYKIVSTRFESYTWRILIIVAIPLVGVVLLYKKPWIGRWVFITLLAFGLLGDLGSLAAQTQNPAPLDLSTVVVAVAMFTFRCWLLWQLLLSWSFLSYMAQMREASAQTDKRPNKTPEPTP